MMKPNFPLRCNDNRAGLSPQAEFFGIAAKSVGSLTTGLLPNDADMPRRTDEREGSVDYNCNAG
jgi:hypothetical protein